MSDNSLELRTDPTGHAHRFIWADRLGIAAFLLMIGFAAALSGGAALRYPLHLLEIGAFAGGAIWFIGRMADFVFTGRIR